MAAQKRRTHQGTLLDHEIRQNPRHRIKLRPAKVLKSPLIEDAYVAFECRLAEVRPYGDHDLFVGEVLAVHHDAHAFNSKDILNPMKARPLLYLGSDFYITIDPDSFKRVLPD